MSDFMLYNTEVQEKAVKREYLPSVKVHWCNRFTRIISVPLVLLILLLVILYYCAEHDKFKRALEVIHNLKKQNIVSLESSVIFLKTH